MKKTMAIILVLCLCVGLCACGNKDILTNGSGGNLLDASQPVNFNNGDDALSVSSIDVSAIKTITDFSNGFAFVQCNDDESVYCIDKTGKVLFALEDCNIINFAKFNSKIAMLERKKAIGEYVICDKEGHIYEAKDFEATRIVLDTDNHKQAFLDGYIILERSEETYTGTKIEMSIIDSDFNTLVPFSVDLAEIINSNEMNINGTNYYDGYLYYLEYDDIILDLRTGRQLTDRKQMKCSTPKLSYWANGTYGGMFSYDHLEWGDIYNELTGEVVAKVAESETISSISFIGDLGLAIYYTDNGVWFNVVAQTGNAKFKPIKAESQEIKFDGETILVANKRTIEKENINTVELELKTYDTLGNLLGEVVLDEWSSWGQTISVNEGVVSIYNVETGAYSLFNSVLEKLF